MDSQGSNIGKLDAEQVPIWYTIALAPKFF